MKVKFISLTLFVICTLCACGGSKNLTSSRVYNEITECQKLAEKNPASRAWAQATHFDESWAKKFATVSARQELASAIRAKVSSAIGDDVEGLIKAAADSAKSQKVNDNGQKKEGMIKEVVDEIVSNAVVIHTDSYTQQNGEYQVYVCVEYQDVSKMASRIVEKIHNLIPDKDRKDMEERFDKLENKLQDELEKYYCCPIKIGI